MKGLIMISNKDLKLLIKDFKSYPKDRKTRNSNNIFIDKKPKKSIKDYKKSINK